MPKKAQLYPPEFRQRIVELLRQGRSAEGLARQFEPSAQAIRNWAKQADRDEGKRVKGLEREELRRLRRENRVLREEREILKKPRPGLRGRPTRADPRIRVRECPSGGPCRADDVSRTGLSPAAITPGASARCRRAPFATWW
jgi:transposase